MSQQQKNKELERHKYYLSKQNFEPDLPNRCFTTFELDHLTKYGYWYQALEEGCINPLTIDQRKFLHSLKKLQYELTIPGKIYIDYKKEFVRWGEVHQILNQADIIELQTLSKIFKEENLSPNQIVDKIRNESNTVLGAFDQTFFGAENCLSYDQVLRKVTSKLGIQSNSKTGKELEREISVKVLQSTLDKMNREQREKFEEELQGIAKQNGVEGYKAGAIFATLTAAQLSGFGVYLLATSALSTISGVIGVTLPFAAYTGLSSALSVIIGPVGWVGAGIFALWKWNDQKFKKLIPAVIFIHWLREKYLMNPHKN